MVPSDSVRTLDVPFSCASLVASERKIEWLKRNRMRQNRLSYTARELHLR